MKIVGVTKKPKSERPLNEQGEEEHKPEYEIEEKIIEIDSSSSIPIYMAPGGGFAIQIVKVE